MTDKEEMTGKKDSNAEAMRSFGLLGSVGLAFVIAIVLGVGGGLLIDRWIGTGHWGFFIGFFLGLAAGVVNVVRASKSIK
jgi:ATP synthase protein I